MVDIISTAGLYFFLLDDTLKNGEKQMTEATQQAIEDALKRWNECDRCGEAETEGNPVNGQWSDRYSAYGDPEPPELTWLCKRCVESEEVPW
jgi:hypothetical protein